MTTNPETSSKAAGLNFQNAAVTSGRDTHINVMSQSLQLPQDAKEILKSRVAFGALFNSGERFDPPRCHPNTRKAVLETIDAWAKNIEGNADPIFWLRGGAGAGKSAITQTSAEKWAELNILAATFFFCRTAAGRNNISQFIATLAYQISLSFPSTWPYMECALLNDVGLFMKSLRTQMIVLIVAPLEAVAPQIGQDRMIIIIDGLDECHSPIGGFNHESQQKEILDTISEIAQSRKSPLRFLVASRPERQIRASFEERTLSDITQIMDLSSIKNSSTFVECDFDRIRATHRHLGPTWPSKKTIDLLVAKSSGHFIYAAVAMKYIGRPRHDPQVSLQAVLDAATARNTPEAPFAVLDALFMLILGTVADSSLPIALQIFQLIVFDDFNKNLKSQIFENIVYKSPEFVERYFFMTPGSSYLHLVDLHSILRIPDQHESASTSIQLTHASFGEFLTNSSRSKFFFLDKVKALEDLQLRKLKHVFIQAMSPDNGRRLGYTPHGAIYYFCYKLDSLPTFETIKDGLLALAGNNQQFSKYLTRMELTHSGSVRNMSSMRALFQTPWSPDIYDYLLKCGIDNADFLFSNENLAKMLAGSLESIRSAHQVSRTTSSPSKVQASRSFGPDDMATITPNKSWDSIDTVSDCVASISKGTSRAQTTTTLAIRTEGKRKRKSPYQPIPPSSTSNAAISQRSTGVADDNIQPAVVKREEPGTVVSFTHVPIIIDLTSDHSD